MASLLDITIPSTSTSATSKPYTIYTISLRQPLRSYTIPKRYSDFVTLHQNLTGQSNGVPPPAPLPSKSWFKSTISSPELTEERRRGLEHYLQAINKAEDSRWRTCSAWYSFLNLPNPESKLASAATHSAVLRSSDLHSPTADPTIWLDTHRELKTVLREARAQLAKRDQASTAQAQHEASASAKSLLVKSGTILLSLGRGLTETMGKDDDRSSISSGSNTYRPPKLGEGEIRRRKDLLSAARKERDSLEALFTTYVSRGGNGAMASDSVEASSSEKDALFKERRLGQVGTSSRRVLGAPLQETAQTRELDNQGVLQLQQQIMEQQDLDVTDLTKAVQRMKEMGMQINDELELQNQMLDVLDRDVERVSDKVGVAKKRIAKIK